MDPSKGEELLSSVTVGRTRELRNVGEREFAGGGLA
jgi:hypothetical protein